MATSEYENNNSYSVGKEKCKFLLCIEAFYDRSLP